MKPAYQSHLRGSDLAFQNPQASLLLEGRSSLSTNRTLVALPLPGGPGRTPRTAQCPCRTAQWVDGCVAQDSYALTQTAGVALLGERGRPLSLLPGPALASQAPRASFKATQVVVQ